MKVKMTPLHGRFDRNGVGKRGINVSIGLSKDSNKAIPSMATKLEPMHEEAIEEDGYSGKSTPKGSSGDESKAPKTAKAMRR